MLNKCKVCGIPYDHKTEDIKDTYSLEVCSATCFLQYIKQQGHSNIKCETRENFGRSGYRSKWEKEFAGFLDRHEIKFDYEPAVLLRNGIQFYLPDFRLVDSGLYVEVKGRWEPGAWKKFSWASEQVPIILLDRHALNRLGLRLTTKRAT